MILTSVTITFFKANNTMGGCSSHHFQGVGHSVATKGRAAC